MILISHEKDAKDRLFNHPIIFHKTKKVIGGGWSTRMMSKKFKLTKKNK